MDHKGKFNDERNMDYGRLSYPPVFMLDQGQQRQVQKHRQLSYFPVGRSQNVHA